MMLFKISNSFFYSQKVAYFVQKQVILIRSNPTYLRCIADQTRSKYDQPTLYRRPPRYTPSQHTTCGERDHPRSFFNRLKNWSRSPRPLRVGSTNPQCILDQHTLPRSRPAHCRFVNFSRAGESGGWAALWCERAFSSVTPYLCKDICSYHMNIMYLKRSLVPFVCFMSTFD